LPLFLQPINPKTEQVGLKTYLLSNPGYTEAVTEVGDEVFLFDATQGEERAKKDEEVIAKLFPGYKKLTVVITDLAWPHVAGVRYWVANGATIIAHKAARGFLQSVVDRRWTLAPDLLERRRETAKLKFVGVDAAYSLAGGAISLHPIDGIGSEVALMAFLAPDGFLWASDYIQTVAEPSPMLLRCGVQCSVMDCIPSTPPRNTCRSRHGRRSRRCRRRMRAALAPVQTRLLR
jgi:hypothetical protein